VDELLPRVYEELHRLAQRFFRDQPPQHTLQPTALVNEAYLRLSSAKDARWNDQGHFYCLAARAMRQILVNHARDRKRLKRGGERQRVPLEDGLAVSTDSAPDLEALDEALASLAKIDARKARVVELRYFAGLSIEETAESIGVSPATVKSDWALSKAWLLEAMSRDEIG